MLGFNLGVWLVPVSASTSEEECEEPVLSPLGMVFVATAVLEGIAIAFLIRKYLKLKKKSGSGTTSVAAPKPVASEIPKGEEVKSCMYM